MGIAFPQPLRHQEAGLDDIGSARQAFGPRETRAVRARRGHSLALVVRLREAQASLPLRGAHEIGHHVHFAPAGCLQQRGRVGEFPHHHRGRPRLQGRGQQRGAEPVQATVGHDRKRRPAALDHADDKLACRRRVGGHQRGQHQRPGEQRASQQTITDHMNSRFPSQRPQDGSAKFAFPVGYSAAMRLLSLAGPARLHSPGQRPTAIGRRLRVPDALHGNPCAAPLRW
ncbi:hypothetical protein D9M68_679580 [compost metagenome]